MANLTKLGHVLAHDGGRVHHGAALWAYVSSCQTLNAAALHQDIEHDAILIDGAPEVVQHFRHYRRIVSYETITPRPARISSTSRKLRLSMW